MHRRIVVLFLFLLAPLARAQDAKAFLEHLRQQTKTPAVSAAVARRGEIVFSGGTGTIDLENDVPAAANSVYNIGSVSKVITAIAVMQLVERGAVALDDDVRKYVPQFPDKGAVITIRQLLTHTSGIRHYRASDFPGTPDNENIRPDFGWADGIRLFASDPLLFPPGKYYSYSSYGVNLLQGVVEKASGESFETYVGKHIWEPSGAASGSFDVPERIVPHRARSYRFVAGKTLNYPYNDLRYKFASGGMIASAEDLVRVAIALNRGRLMKPETRAAMLAPQIDGVLRFRENAPAEAMEFRQAMLWRVNKDGDGREFVYHCGSVRGFNVCLIDYVRDDLVAVVASNSEECCGWRPALAIANLFR